MRRSGTNPTAAAIGGLLVLQPQVEQDLLTDAVRQDVAEFLLDNITDEGGLRANTQIPIADLLSTYTGLQTIRDVGAWSEVDTSPRNGSSIRCNNRRAVISRPPGTRSQTWSIRSTAPGYAACSARRNSALASSRRTVTMAG